MKQGRGDNSPTNEVLSNQLPLRALGNSGNRYKTYAYRYLSPEMKYYPSTPVIGLTSQSMLIPPSNSFATELLGVAKALVANESPSVKG